MGENLKEKSPDQLTLLIKKLNGPKKKLGSTVIYWTDMENIFIVKDTMTYRGTFGSWRVGVLGWIKILKTSIYE